MIEGVKVSSRAALALATAASFVLILHQRWLA